MFLPAQYAWFEPVLIATIVGGRSAIDPLRPPIVHRSISGGIDLLPARPGPLIDYLVGDGKQGDRIADEPRLGGWSPGEAFSAAAAL
jgi:hypothetical protein